MEGSVVEPLTCRSCTGTVRRTVTVVHAIFDSSNFDLVRALDYYLLFRTHSCSCSFEDFRSALVDSSRGNTIYYYDNQSFQPETLGPLLVVVVVLDDYQGERRSRDTRKVQQIFNSIATIHLL